MATRVDPIELCLESLDTADDERPYVRCVALAGGQPGLGLTAEGIVIWQHDKAASLLLWVSADNRLMSLRSSEACGVCLTRAERRLDLPPNKPVVTLHGDIIEIEGRAFRVHVHGVAASVLPPTRLSLRRAKQWITGAVAAASLAACHTSGAGNTPASAGGSPSNEFAQPPPSGTTGGTDDGIGQGGTGATPPIEIREMPPAPVPSPPDDHSGS